MNVTTTIPMNEPSQEMGFPLDHTPCRSGASTVLLADKNLVSVIRTLEIVVNQSFCGAPNLD